MSFKSEILKLRTHKMDYLKYSTCLLLVCAVCICYADRKIDGVIVNPNCTSECKNGNLVYAKAVGDKDAIHYLWTTHGSVSMLMVTTSREAVVNVRWDKFLSSNTSGSITFSSSANATSAVVFTRLYEYDDVSDVVDVEDVKTENIKTHRTSSFNWNDVSASGIHAQFLNTGEDGTTAGNASLELNLKAFGSEGEDEQLPSLKHTANSFQLELVLNRFLTNSDYKNTRYAVELLVTDSQVSSDNKVEMGKEKSIDDEYTPGVFLTYTMKPTQSDGCFLVWKPVCYTSDERTTEYSTNTQQDLSKDFPTRPNRTSEMTKSLAYAYYGEALWDMTTNGLNISFGLQEDKYYQKTNYSTWTVVIGSGIPADEKFSSTVIIVIVVGFGVPALAIMVGGTFIIVRNFRKKPDVLEVDPKLLEEEDE